MDGKDFKDVPSDGTEVTSPSSRPLLYNVTEAAAALGVSDRKVWQLIYENRLDTVWLDGRRLIPTPVLDDFVAGLPSEKPDLAAAR